LSEVTPVRFVQTYNMGCPRVGNLVWTQFVTQMLGQYYRLTHARDPVPRVPPYDVLLFVHPPQEVWYPNCTTPSPCVGRICSATNGEDPTCDDSVLAYDIYDHLDYLGYNIDCEMQPWP